MSLLRPGVIKQHYLSSTFHVKKNMSITNFVIYNTHLSYITHLSTCLHLFVTRGKPLAHIITTYLCILSSLGPMLFLLNYIQLLFVTITHISFSHFINSPGFYNFVQILSLKFQFLGSLFLGIYFSLQYFLSQYKVFSI